MSIGAISAYGSISALSFRPYVYNTNTIGPASMNKLSKISDDVLDKKIDYNELTDESLNENPLKKGQTLDFQGILDMQMRRGQNNAARIMKPMEGTPEVSEETAEGMPGLNVDAIAARTEAEDMREKNVAEVNADNAANVSDGNNINYQMQQALCAYEMFMTA